MTDTDQDHGTDAHDLLVRIYENEKLSREEIMQLVDEYVETH